MSELIFTVELDGVEYMLTPRFRWAVPSETSTQPAKLQQLWIERSKIVIGGLNEPKRRRWMDVPIEVEEASGSEHRH